MGKLRKGWCTKEVRKGHGVRLWKAIRGNWEIFKNKMDFLRLGLGTK